VSCGTSDPAPLEEASAATGSSTEAVTDSDDVQRISPLEARVLVEGGGAVLYDTRSADSYGSQHAAGAISFPESEASRRIGELPTDKTLIFY
jgi:rhodanese-related sulfurtransferase